MTILLQNRLRGKHENNKESFAKISCLLLQLLNCNSANMVSTEAHKE